jgi:hypothetical protein
MTAASKALERPVLVLNRNWTPIKTTTVKGAIGLVAKGSAKIIEPAEFTTHDLLSWADVSKAKEAFAEVMIRSPRLALVPPEVLVLTVYDGMAEGSVTFSRRNIFKRDKYTCQYCGVQPGPEELTIDHVVPRARGGISSWTNCVLACIPCNKEKADKLLGKSGLRLKKVPRKPSWKVLAQAHPNKRRESWKQFLSRAYWEVGLEP